MAKIIAMANQKGGVGKTTTCVNLCCALTQRNIRVLLCDIDPQGNATSGTGVDKGAEPNMYSILINGVSAADAVINTRYCDVIPSNKVLSGAGIELINFDSREFVLRNALSPMRDEYDYIFIDCPPSLEMLTLNALCAADAVLIPLQCEYYAMEGLTDLLATVKMTRKRLNQKLTNDGIILTMYDKRTKLSSEVAEEVRKHFGNLVYDTVIPRNIRLSEAPSHGKPAIVYERMSLGSRSYLKLASEFLRRESNDTAGAHINTGERE